MHLQVSRLGTNLLIKSLGSKCARHSWCYLFFNQDKSSIWLQVKNQVKSKVIRSLNYLNKLNASCSGGEWGKTNWDKQTYGIWNINHTYRATPKSNSEELANCDSLVVVSFLHIFSFQQFPDWFYEIFSASYTPYCNLFY